jgi:dGTPase
VKQSAGVRQRTEDYERASLSTWATLAIGTKGRERHEDADPLRTAFQQDRDRIVHCDAFRRLAGKTRAFLPAHDRLAADGDRSRLTHVLEVSQVARTIARALRLNEDLVEAVALGAELGWPPFADAGAEALGVFTDDPFREHEQSVRVVEVLERGGRGLNLTWEVREGILHHPTSMPPPATAEGQAVRLAAVIVTATAGLGAALDAGIVEAGQVPAAVRATLGADERDQLAALVTDAVETSLDQPEVRLSPRTDQALAELLAFLDLRVHARPASRGRRDRALHCLRSLVVYHLEHPADLPPPARPDDPLVVRVLDAVSGMADARAVATFERLFLPGPPGT